MQVTLAASPMGARCMLRAARGPAMPLTTEQVQKHLAQAEQHVAETKAHVARHRQIVKALAPNNELREGAMQMLAILEDSLRLKEQHGELIRRWLEKGE